ncbi:MAG: 6-phosphogluconate dehydrogenase [Candidatus Thermochlorobacter sp.]
MTTVKKFGIIGGVSFLVLFLLVFLFLYHGTYSKGERGGVVVKITEKGYIFKTFEGQLNTLIPGAVGSTQQNMFYFSVERDRQDVIKALKEAALTGERVGLEYEEKYVQFFWRGDTKYFVTAVKRANAPPALPPTLPSQPSAPQ